MLTLFTQIHHFSQHFRKALLDCPTSIHPSTYLTIRMISAEIRDGFPVKWEEIGISIGCIGEAENGIYRISCSCECKCRWQLFGDILEAVLGVQLVAAVESTVHASYPLKLGSHFVSHLPHLTLLFPHHHNEYISAKSGLYGHSLFAETHAEGVQSVQNIHFSLVGFSLSLKACLEISSF